MKESVRLLLAGIALMVGEAALLSMVSLADHVDWTVQSGAIADWVAGLGSLAAVVAALWIANLEGARERDRRRHEAKVAEDERARKRAEFLDAIDLSVDYAHWCATRVSFFVIGNEMERARQFRQDSLARNADEALAALLEVKVTEWPAAELRVWVARAREAVSSFFQAALDWSERGGIAKGRADLAQRAMERAILSYWMVRRKFEPATKHNEFDKLQAYALAGAKEARFSEPSDAPPSR